MNQRVHDPVVQLVAPEGRARRPVPDEEPREAEAVLAARPWRRVTWRFGTKRALSARFAVTRVRIGDGAVWANNWHLPGAEGWLVGGWRSSGERKIYLANLRWRAGVCSRGPGGGGGHCGKSTLDHPASRQQHEAALGLGQLHAIQGDAVIGCCFRRALTCVALIDMGEVHAGSRLHGIKQRGHCSAIIGVDRWDVRGASQSYRTPALGTAAA